ncbi:prolyl-tRNA synthetase associated domain-containing protein [Ruminococcus sp.]|jgi:Ala-tRNA(Pro) deacylase|uniref:prolyl-tRNA synthetase associated domain-containing protein n=1 Tax=Ruminococcus sp. TaxID=41978 RepID=UPI002621096C|nr:prolyl-tRNA synthetase associated domain-containing protein [Ruminococcus sp.]MEE1398308.1 prolyl-tRNA synthetase associated domain-containing protein [Ruminococcus sp.]
MTIETGRPADCSGRPEKECAVYDLLERLDIPFTRADHPAAFTMEECEAVSQALHTPICKNLFLCNRQKTAFYLLLLPASKPFRTKEITAQLGCARLSFAGEEQLASLLHLTPGSATIFGLQYDTENRVQLVVDRDLLDEAYFGCHPCINTSTIRLKTSDVFDRLTHALHHDYTLVTLKGE